MKDRYRLFLRRKSVFYAFDTETNRFESLRTRDRTEARNLLHAKNEACRQPQMNVQLARVYLQHSDPAAASRRWQSVMEEIVQTKTGENRSRWEHIIRAKALDPIRSLVVLETKPADFLKVLRSGGVSINVYLRRICNFALDMNWLPWPILPKREWPPVRYKSKRGITLEEHQRIAAREPNEETRAFYETLWHLGGSQSDIANLRAEDIDWNDRVISFFRRKTGTAVQIAFGDSMAAILQKRPHDGFLFPRLAPMHEKHRAKEFNRRCKGLGIAGVSLHSYRYAWAERAKTAGYPERFAQAALGHNSAAIHRAYARKAQVKLPALEEYERALNRKILDFPAVTTKSTG